MPYKKIGDLPDAVRHVLPEHAQEIYMKAFNNAWPRYKEAAAEQGESQEGIAAKVAWSAVKREYVKAGAKWVKKLKS